MYPATHPRGIRLPDIRLRHRGATGHPDLRGRRLAVDDQAEEVASQTEDMANPNPLANTKVELFSAGFTDVTVRS